MENLRAFMVVNSLRDAAEGTDFDFLPNDVESNPESAAFIVEHGFFLRFVNEEARSAAVPIVTGVGSVSTYQLFDYKAEPEAAEPAAAVIEPAAVPVAAASAADSAATLADFRFLRLFHCFYGYCFYCRLHCSEDYIPLIYASLSACRLPGISFLRRCFYCYSYYCSYRFRYYCHRY